MNKSLLLAVACVAASLAPAAPYLPAQLQLRVTVQPSLQLGVPPNTMYNPRFFDGDIYANQINNACFGRYHSGCNTLLMGVNNNATPALEHRMVAPFRGAYRSTYLLGSGSATSSSTTFTRYDFNGSNAVTTPSPNNMIVDAFDWVDDDTIIYALYGSGHRNKLCLADVVPNPFSVVKNTTWNANGYVFTSVTTRIRNVRKGDVYGGHAYYGDAGQNNSPNFYALNLATGIETILGNAGTLTGGNSFGVWTVLERGGYLYVQTTDNGILVYNMTSATTLGSLYTTYTKQDLDANTGGSAQYFGLDVSPDGTRLLLGGFAGKVFELGPPQLTFARSGTDLLVSWPAPVTSVILQSSATLPTGFADHAPAPSVVTGTYLNTATIPITPESEKAFFRLRKSW